MISCFCLSDPGDIKDIAETIAIFAAAGFFLWKAIVGWLVINLQISIDTERQSFDDKDDLLGFKINFTKGNIDTLQIMDIKARMYIIDDETQEIKKIVKEFSFSEIQYLKRNSDKEILWEVEKIKRKNIGLSPEESFHLGRYHKVPKGQPIIIEAALFGIRLFWIKGFQWRASVVSLPPKKDAKG